MTDDLEQRIDVLYAAVLGAFTGERDALAAGLKAEGDLEGTKRVKALRKPVVTAWVVNQLARRDPEGIRELLALGGRLRAAQGGAISGGDVDALREALHERRRLVASLAKGAAELAAPAVATATQLGEITATLEAAAADEQAGEAVRAGRLTKPLKPPTSFGGPVGLQVLEGGRDRSADGPAASRKGAKAGAAAEAEADREPKEARRTLQRELASAETRERKATEGLGRAKARLAGLDRKRANAKEAVRAAEADLRGATLERKRLAVRLHRG